MISIQEQRCLFQSRELFPNLYKLSKLDTFDPSTQHTYYIPLVNCSSQNPMFARVAVVKDRPTYQLCVYDGQMSQVPNVPVNYPLEKAQIIRKDSMVCITRTYTITQSSFFLRKQTRKQYWETMVYSIRSPSSKETLKTEVPHYAHFLTDSLMLYFEKQHVQFFQLSAKGGLYLIHNEAAIMQTVSDCRGYDGKFVLVYFISKLNYSVCVIELYGCVEDRPVMEVRLTTKWLQQGQPFTHTFCARFHPVSILQQQGKTIVVNFQRRELLLIDLPMPNLDCQELAGSQDAFKQFLYYQQSWQPVFLDGALLFIRQRFSARARDFQTVSVYLNGVQRTKVAYSTSCGLESFDSQEVVDFLDAIPYIAQEQEVKTVQDAIRACREYVSLFYMRHRRLAYVPFQMEYHAVMTSIPRDFLQMFQTRMPVLRHLQVDEEEARDAREAGCSDTENRNSALSGQQHEHSQGSSLALSDTTGWESRLPDHDIDYLQQIIERFGPRVREYAHQTRDEDSCVSRGASRDATVADASQSLVRFSRHPQPALNIPLLETTLASKDMSAQFSVQKAEENEPEEQEDSEEQNARFQQFLQPTECDDRKISFQTEFLAQIQNVPCPTHFGQLQMPQIFRLFQIMQPQASQDNGEQSQPSTSMLFFDFQLQTVNSCELSVWFKPETFQNVMTAQASEEGFLSKNRLHDALQTSLKRQLYFEGLLRSGFFSQTKQVISVRPFFGNILRQIASYPDIQTGSVFNLVLSKAISAVHLSFGQSGLPFLKSLLTLVGNQLSKFTYKQLSFIEHKTDETDAGLVRMHRGTSSTNRLEASSKEPSWTGYLSLQTLFLPESDGQTLLFQHMPHMQEVGGPLDQEPLDQRLLRVDVKQTAPKYISKQLSPDTFRLVNSRLLSIFTGNRLCFEGVELRSFYDPRLNQQYHSTTHSVFQAIRQHYFALVQGVVVDQNEIQALQEQYQNLADVFTTTLSATLEFISAQFHTEPQAMALVECLEGLQVMVGSDFKKMISHVFCHPSDEQDIALQLASFGVI